MRVFHVGDEHSQQTEDEKENKFGLRTRATNGRNYCGHRTSGLGPEVEYFLQTLMRQSYVREATAEDGEVLYPDFAWERS
jgi:hypothetical protein